MSMAMETLTGDLSSAVLVGSVIACLSVYIWRSRPSGIPPLPKTPLPLIGNVLSIEKDPRRLFGKWRKEFGDVFSIYLGSQLVVVLNGYDCMKEALVKNADVFSDRPDSFLNRYVFKGRGILATSGPVWKSQRKFALTCLRDFGMGRNSMEGRISEEVEHILKYFASKQGKKEHFDSIYNLATSNILCKIIFGRRFEYDDPLFLGACQALDNFIDGFANTGLAACFPFLLHIPGDLVGVKALLKNTEFVEEKLIKPEIERHLKEYDGTVTDFISTYIKEIKDKEDAGEDATVLKENFVQTLTDLFAGATETTSVTLKWFILFLIKFPQVQGKCFQEIKDNVGLDRLPELKDKPSLPYVEATLAETQRRSNIFITGAVHGTSETTTFRGFTLPKGTAVLLNMDSVLMDPKVWPNPDDFRPERFLDQDGCFFKPEAFIPFSTGRRVCLGQSVAKMELFLIGAALVQHFHFQIPEDEPNPTLEGIISAITLPAPYKVKAVPRK